jgi:hypothetical protein
VNTVTAVVFSKDRPLQVHGCLESLFGTHGGDIPVTVIFGVSSRRMFSGYKEVKKHFPRVRWEFEQSTEFFNLTRAVVQTIETDLLMFLVDDIVFTSPWSTVDAPFLVLDEFPDTVQCSSLRLHPGITRCYASGELSPVPTDLSSPKGHPGAMVWNWTRAVGDWGYPMSLDGNVYRTGPVRQMINSVGFGSPNYLEAALDSIKHHPHADVKSHMVCYRDGPRVINIPSNRVQNEFKNAHENSTQPDVLLDLYMSNQRLDWVKYQGLVASTVHVPTVLELKEV